MEQISHSSIQGRKFFTSSMPDVVIGGTDGTSRHVTITCDGSVVLEEDLWPSANAIVLMDLGSLLEPFARKQLVCSVTITADADAYTMQALFSMADVGIDADEFYGSHFLSILMGTKITARGRRELVWMYGSDAASVTAEYDDGTTRSFAVSPVGGSDTYTCLDVSPGAFTASGKTLVAYTVTAGSRSQRFEMDLSEPDCAPILEFYNSFGVWEMIYCTGAHKVTPDYKRSATRIGGMLRNYHIEETRTFKADTGFLGRAMANWADDLFRSPEVYVVNVENGSVVSRDSGKEVVITDSKSDNSNEDDFTPRFTFSYQYSQRIQNVLQLSRVGRIFDNTFDQTFN